MNSIPPEEHEVLDRLDRCWTQYLALLEQYTEAQHHIQKACSVGFLTLARANARAPSGMRYGQDWYDGRMKASCRVATECRNAREVSDATAETFDLVIESNMPSAVDGKILQPPNEASSNSKAASDLPLPTPPGTPVQRETSLLPDGTTEPATYSDATSLDPLKWYGILTPPDLRRAQDAFQDLLGGRAGRATDTDRDASGTSTARLSPIATAAKASRQLRELEAEIRKLRKSAHRMRRLEAA